MITLTILLLKGLIAVLKGVLWLGKYLAIGLVLAVLAPFLLLWWLAKLFRSESR